MHNIFVAVSNLFFSPSIFSIGWLPSAIYLKLNWKLVFSVDFVIRMVFNAQPTAKQFNLIVLDFFFVYLCDIRYLRFVGVRKICATRMHLQSCEFDSFARHAISACN